MNIYAVFSHNGSSFSIQPNRRTAVKQARKIGGSVRVADLTDCYIVSSEYFLSVSELVIDFDRQEQEL